MKSSGPLNVGYIGCGKMGKVFLQAARSIPSVHSIAVADVFEPAVRQVSEQFGIERAYTDVTQLFADPQVDAIVLALPAQMRTELAIQAFRAGKHVLTEKPVARNVEEVERMIEVKGDLIAGCTSSRTRLLDSAQVVANVLKRRWSYGEFGSFAYICFLTF